jgi:hypothetical protein
MPMITLECDYDVKIGLDDDGDLSARKTTAKQATVKKA